MRLIDFADSTLSMSHRTVSAVIVHARKFGLKRIEKLVLAQISTIGVQAIPIIGIIAVITGALVIVQSYAQLTRVGGGGSLGTILVAFIIREVAPILTAFVVIAKSGTKVATDLGNMKVNGEVLALESMGIHPLMYLVFPRLLGGAISLFCLSIYFCMVALLSGYIVNLFVHPIPLSYYIQIILNSINFWEISIFVLKNIVSGLIIFAVCSFNGFKAEKSNREVSDMTTRAVVHSLAFTIGFNAILSLALNLENIKKLGLL